MNNTEEIRKMLLERKVQLEKDLSALYKEKVSDDQVQDTGDQALSSNLEEIKISLHNNERDEYQMIIKALEMLNSGSYGVCIDCGNNISEKRLRMFPNATRCLVCQEAAEEGKY